MVWFKLSTWGRTQTRVQHLHRQWSLPRHSYQMSSSPNNQYQWSSWLFGIAVPTLINVAFARPSALIRDKYIYKSPTWHYTWYNWPHSFFRGAEASPIRAWVDDWRGINCIDGAFKWCTPVKPRRDLDTHISLARLRVNDHKGTHNGERVA